jgi:hypothetical protein
MKQQLKQLVGPEWQARAHRLSRLRWITKYRLMRSFGGRIGLRRQLGYVLLDPETESFSFELDDERQVISALAQALGRSEDELAGYAAETRTDPELNEALARHVRWRFDVKRRMPLGYRLPWYIFVRALKPALVVETGIYHGLGSLVLLRALARNAQAGSPGELMSFDTDQRAGSVVRDEVRRDWRRFAGSTHDLLLPALHGRHVDMLFQDTPHTEENQRFEFGAALAHAAPRLLLVDGSGGYAKTLAAICRERDVPYHRVPLRSRAHVYSDAAIAFALVEVPDTGCRGART